MSPVPPHSTRSSPSPSSSVAGAPVVIARVTGILSVAGGFVLGIHGLDEPGSRLLPTALGMIAAGLIAQIFALVRSWYLLARRTE